MAEILPKDPIGRVSPEVGKVFSRLKSLDDSFRIRWNLPVTPEQRPEFLVTYEDRFVFLLAVSTLSLPKAESLLQGSFTGLLFSEPSLSIENFAQKEETTLAGFIKVISGTPSAVPGVVPLILFPNLPQSKLEPILKIRAAQFRCLGKEALIGQNLGMHFRSLARHPAAPVTMDRVRSHFSPELTIPRRILPNQGRTNQVAPTLTNYLLDYDQEKALKLDLALSANAKAAVHASGPRLITGIAGSGKTLVLLHRAALMERLDPGKSILIVTHNKPLINDLERRLAALSKNTSAECIHFLSWCCQQAPGQRDVLRPHEKEKFIADAAARIEKVVNFPISFLSEEIDWIKDYEATSLDVYLRAKRVGRGRRLSEQQRLVVFALYKKYEELLSARSREDWPGIPLRLLQSARQGKVELPRYDYVFVDEAQFFAPVWLKLIEKVVTPGTGQLLLAADPTQGFLKRRESWAASGIKVRNRTIRLERAYRNSRDILDYAAAFYRRRVPVEDEDVNLPTLSQIAQLPSGARPQVITVSAAQDEISRTCNEVRQAIARGASPADILIIDSAVQPRNSLVASALNKGSHQPIASDAQKQNIPGSARVCSLNSATGLEAPIVFILGISELLQAENSLRLHDEDRNDLTRDNTRKLYMAMTRATQRLVLFVQNAYSLGVNRP